MGEEMGCLRKGLENLGLRFDFRIHHHRLVRSCVFPANYSEPGTWFRYRNLAMFDCSTLCFCWYHDGQPAGGEIATECVARCSSSTPYSLSSASHSSVSTPTLKSAILASSSLLQVQTPTSPSVWPTKPTTSAVNGSAFCSATLVGFGSLGGIVGSTVFRSEDRPGYVPGISVAIGSQVVICLAVAALTLDFKRQNGKADRGEKVLEEGDASFRYTY